MGIGGVGGPLIIYSSGKIVHNVKLRTVTLETVYMIIKALKIPSLAVGSTNFFLFLI